MHRFLCLCLLSVFFYGSKGHCQATEPTHLSVIYNTIHVVDTTAPEKPQKYQSILRIGKTHHAFSNYDAEKSELRYKQFLEKNPNLDIKISGRTEFFGAPYLFFQNRSDQKFFSIAKLQDVTYAIEENYSVPKWLVSSDTKTISGFECQKATTELNGRLWEAWFSPQLAYPLGPWKLGGLPGLILEAYDSQQEIKFSFASLDDTSTTAIVFPKNTTSTTLKKLNQTIQALGNGAGMGATNGAIMMVQGGGAGSQTKRIQFNNLLEKKY